MENQKYIIAMDQGTTSSRCVVFNQKGEICSQVFREFPQIYPEPGWVEHNPMEIWSSQMGVTMEAMDKMGASAEDIAAIGITNQRETSILWDAQTGKPVYNAIVWQCRRTAGMIDALNADVIMADKIRERTGLVPDAYFSASKIAWMLENVPGLRARAEAGEIRFGTVDTWLIWNLTGGKVHATDYTNASRTMLFDIHKLCWDDEILSYFKIPKCILPEVKPSSGLFGTTTRLGGEIPITGVAGDQQAALFGQCGFEPGDVKSTYGTGGFLLMNTGDRAVESNKGLLTTIAANSSDEIQYALEGGIFIEGAALQWLRDEMRMLRNTQDSERYCTAVEDTNGVYVVPAFSGLGAPHWQQYARGTVVGLTRGVTKEHFIRATLESLAYQTEDVLNAMEEDSGIPMGELKVDGGACANSFLMQFQADISNIRILRPNCIETTSLGAAYLAGLAVGYWKNKEEIKANWSCAKEFRPNMASWRRAELLRGWRRAVRCAIFWAQEEHEA